MDYFIKHLAQRVRDLEGFVSEMRGETRLEKLEEAILQIKNGILKARNLDHYKTLIQAHSSLRELIEKEK